MIQLNGQNGGGQILRTALSLSMITGKPFHLKNIRGKRPKPGLMRQHLTCVQSAAKVCDAATDGATMHSHELIFHPGKVKAGDYHIKIGTAGSTTLVAQTLLPALWKADSPSTLRIEGGTHNPMAPPFEFIENIFLPTVAKLGFQANINLIRHGFAPAGGGEIALSIEPVSKLSPHHWLEQGKLISQTIHCITAHIPDSVAGREIDTAQKELDWPINSSRITQAQEAECPGNIFSIEAIYENASERITSFGAHNRSAEVVAKEAVKKMKDYLNSKAVIGRCLADQLLIPMSLAGESSFLTMTPSNHLKTNAHVIESFLPVKFSITKEEELWKVSLNEGP